MTRVLIVAMLLSVGICQAQEAKVIKLPELQQKLAQNSGKIHIFNFWATWCGPCVKELPYFEKINAEGGPEIKVTLVSLDLDLDPNPEKVHRFIKLKQLRSEVLMLDESNPDLWIDKIEKQWSGALPATLIINHKTGKRIFVGRELQEGQLEQYLDQIQ